MSHIFQNKQNETDTQSHCIVLQTISCLQLHWSCPLFSSFICALSNLFFCFILLLPSVPLQQALCMQQSCLSPGSYSLIWRRESKRACSLRAKAHQHIIRSVAIRRLYAILFKMLSLTSLFPPAPVFIWPLASTAKSLSSQGHVGKAILCGGDEIVLY